MNQINLWLVISFVIAGITEVLAPIGLAFWLWRRLQAPWKFFWMGVLVFVASQGVTRIPAMVVLQMQPWFQQALKEPTYLWLFFVFAAITAGLFEETGRWLAFRYAIRPQDRTWRNSVMIGAGHGGIESIGIGVLAILSLIGYIVISMAPSHVMGANVEQFETARRQYEALLGWEPLLGAWERLCAITLHLAFSILVLFSVVRRFRWWWLALLAHATVDFVAVATLHVTSRAWGQTTGMVITEFVVTAMAIAAAWFVLVTRPKDIEIAVSDAHFTDSA